MKSSTPALDAALDAARKDARPVIASEPGGRSRSKDPSEAWWYYPPTDVVMAEASRLLDAHGLEIDLLGQRLGDKGEVRTRWRLRHRPSGEFLRITWEAEIFEDSETRTTAVLATVRHAKRSLHVELLKIPVVRKASKGDRVENGVIVARAAGPASADRVIDGVTVDVAPPRGTREEEFELPSWAQNNAPMDDAIADPGQLPGDEIDAEAAAEAERAELAPEADAAARGEVHNQIDMAALFRRVTAWRSTHQGNVRVLAGASVSGPLTQADAAAIDQFLVKEGF